MSNLSAANTCSDNKVSNNLSCVDSAYGVVSASTTGTTAANSLSWIDPSAYTTTLGGNYTINTNGNSWLTVGNGIDYGYFKDTTMETLFLYLKEEEISEIFNKIAERESDSEKIKSIVSRVVRVRHFSEEFLLEYISYMDMSDITVMHNADIKSGEYPNIALIIEGLK